MAKPHHELLLTEFASFSNDLDERFNVGDPEIDASHQEFLALAQHVAAAPGSELAPALNQLFEHTKDHFINEESWMQSLDHKLFREHRAEHQRILGDMERFYQRAEAGRGAMARAWVSDNLLEWFSAHTRTMDSALAAQIRREIGDDQD